MCGIIGYAGGDSAAKIIYEGLKNLEYRGYDSAGMAVVQNGRISIEKRLGRVEKLHTFAQNAAGNMGIGHTRWATHGKPSDKNAHPHLYGGVCIVHNGIIENYAAVREKLLARGEIFRSETDSEVIAHLIADNYCGDLLGAVIKSVKTLKGSYALLAICSGGGQIVAARSRSPLILGLGKNCNFAASDMSALAGKCPEVCVLGEGEFASISAERVKIFNSDGAEIPVISQPNTAVAEDYCKRGFPHYMLKELWEAPAAVRRTAAAFADVAKEVKAALSGADKIVFTGCGTAYHAAMTGRRYAEEFARVNAETEYAGELRYKNPVITPKTALVAVTQSGETADTVEAARLYKSRGAKVVAVTNCMRSEITRIADVCVPVCAGPEICVAATKSYSGQLAAMYLIALQLAEGDTAGLREELAAAPSLILETLEKLDIYALADMCAQSGGVYFLGRDMDYAVALEGSLKLKEVSYIAGGGYPAGELKHGTLALIDGGTLSVFVITDERLASKSSAAVEQVLSRGGKAAVISGIYGVQSQFEGRAEVIKIPPCGKYVAPFAAASVLHFLAYRTAVVMGRDPDMPRNLAKSVTVE